MITIIKITTIIITIIIIIIIIIIASYENVNITTVVF